jgi:hypothetical protein
MAAIDIRSPPRAKTMRDLKREKAGAQKPTSLPMPGRTRADIEIT